MTGRRTKIALRIAAGLLAVLSLSYGAMQAMSVRGKKHGVTVLAVGVVFAAYAALGRTGLRALDE